MTHQSHISNWAANGRAVVPSLPRAFAIAVLALAALLFGVPGVQAEPVKADVTVNMSGGYARVVLRFSEEIDADVRMSNNILVVTFKTKVSVPVDLLVSNASGYVGAARSDPDGMGIRLALARK